MAAEFPSVIFLTGPTAAGKTEFAAQLFDQFDCELINVDAAQVFRGMNIGTAKPSPAFLKQYPHHLIDICDIDSSYSAAQFCKDATRLVDQAIELGKLPILVGGTLFYFSALEKGLSVLPSANKDIREQIKNEIEENSLESIHQMLLQIDPNIGQRIKSTDYQRIQRAMEIYYITKLPPSEVMLHSRSSGLPYPIIKIALFSSDRKSLHARIGNRFNDMLEDGFVDEVRSLIQGQKRPRELSSMRSVGYRQVLSYLYQEIDYDEMVNSGIAATRQLAKRQLTWLRNQSNVVWFDASHSKSSNAVTCFIRSHPAITLGN